MLYFAGVPGAAKLGIHVTPSGVVAALADELNPQLESSGAVHRMAMAAKRARFDFMREPRMRTWFARI